VDFSQTQEQKDLAKLAAKMFAELAPATALPDFEIPHDGFDASLWRELAKAELLGVALPEDVGGSGMGLIELAILIEEAGKALAPVPLVPTLAIAAAAIDAFGSPAQRKGLLPRVASGDLVLTVALADAGSLEAERPTTQARPDGKAWRIEGKKLFVPVVSSAGRVLVPARTEAGGVAVFLVDPQSDGIALEPTLATTGERQHEMRFEGVRATRDDLLGTTDAGKTILDWVIDRALAGLCAFELGVADRALRMTAKYTSERRQFGKPIATFQAVAQRAADAYIDVEAIRLSTWQALWRLASGRPARRELLIAKFWASEGGHRACYAAQHLHGGIGVDTDYPLHRYYLMSRQIELTLGGAHAQLARLGRLLADEQSTAR
jgi:alkylation response protein AidB-like acyl-CoA dehydrogenase